MSNSRHGKPDGTTANSPRVAVDVLQRDQRQILFDGNHERDPAIYPLSGQFDHTRQVINWWQAAAVRTFGYLSDVYPAEMIYGDRWTTRALVGGERSHAHHRQRLVEMVVEACDRAYRDLESRAQEWLAGAENSSENWETIDPEQQEHLAMRPAFSKLDEQQAIALEALWDGFADRTEWSRWAHSLPAVADFSGVLGDSVTGVISGDQHAKRMLVSDSSQAHHWRDRFAANVLLPAFAKRARKMQAGERATRAPTTYSAPPG